MDLDTFHKFLSTHKLKFTRARRLIFEELFSSEVVHPNAYEIHRRLKSKGEEVSLATIYRTLSLLVKSGLVNEIDLGENHHHYEPGISKLAHGHLVCLSCGRVQEFSHKELREVLSNISRESKFRVDKFSIQVFGYCKDCQKR